VSRLITVGVCQLGPIQRSQRRAAVVRRLIDLLQQAAQHGCALVVFPELALTSFFPRWWMTDQEEIDAFFERDMPSSETLPLFEEARRLGHADHEPWRAFQHLEKRYFEIGDLGWGVWKTMGANIGMCICNDRRWPETYRVMGLQGVEMVLVGYNTPRHNPPAPDHDRLSEFHNQLSLQAGAYANATWVVAAAKCGVEEGCEMIGNSSIVAPNGLLVAQALSQEDELVVARCDLDLASSYRATTFNFARHRQPQHYRLIVERTGAIAPE
jgi:predicted amidohydrolase